MMIALTAVMSLLILSLIIALARTPLRSGMRGRGGYVGGYQVGDAALTDTLALPNGAATTHSTGLDVAGGVPQYGDSSQPSMLANMELLITAPALTAAQLPDGDTMTYSVETALAADPTFNAPTTLIAAALVQTGAAGAGAATAMHRYRLPTDFQASGARYIRLSATNSAAGNCSTVSATQQMVF